MKFSNHLIILSTIMLGYWLDDSLNTVSIKLFLELNFGFLIFAYWVFALPEKIQSSAALIYGLAIDLFFSNVIVFNMLFFTGTSYIIHLYVFDLEFFLISNYRFSFLDLLPSIQQASIFCFLLIIIPILCYLLVF